MQPSPGAGSTQTLSGSQITLHDLASDPPYRPQPWNSSKPPLINADGWLGLPDPKKYPPTTVHLSEFELKEEKRKGNIISLKDLQQLPLETRHAWLSKHYEQMGSMEKGETSEQVPAAERRRHGRYSVHQKFNLVAFLLNKREFKLAGRQPLPETESGTGTGSESDDGPFITLQEGSRRELPMTMASHGQRAGERSWKFLGNLQEAHEMLMDYMKHNVWIRLRDGSRVSFWNLFKYVEENPELEAMVQRDMRACDPVQGETSKWERMHSLEPWEVRPGAPKMVLPQEQENKLPFGLVANSNVWEKKPTPWLKGLDTVRDFAYALYANEAGAEEVLGPLWGRTDPKEVLASPDFLDDVLHFGPDMGLSLMFIASRDLPLEETKQAWTQKVGENLERLDAPKESWVRLAMLEDMFDPEVLAEHTKLLTADGTKLREGSKVLMCTAPRGRLLVQATSPGRLKDQESYTLGAMQDEPLCWALLGTFLGPEAHDPDFVQRAAKRMLFYINGFKSRNADNNPNQMLPGGDLPFEAEVLPATPDIFVLPPVGHPPYPTLMTRVADRLAFTRVAAMFEDARAAVEHVQPASDPQVTFERRRQAAEQSIRGSLASLGLPVEALLKRMPDHMLMPATVDEPALMSRGNGIAVISSVAEPLTLSEKR